MNIVESALSLLAPHNCVGCAQVGNVLCETCAYGLQFHPSRCYKCYRVTVQSRTCADCRREVSLARVWTIAAYEGAAKDAVYKLKYERAKSAAADIARVMNQQLPIIPKDVVVTHLPTASSRIRVRGYDQAQLVAKQLAKDKGLTYKPLLIRSGKSRQVGSGRQNRFTQLEGAFHAKKSARNCHILLIDDVLTTGASIESAASALNRAGARKIEAAVFAHA